MPLNQKARNPDAQIRSAAAKIQAATGLRPRLAIVLGSGFHPFAAEVEIAAKFKYRDLPGFPAASVAGHAGELLIGHLDKTPLLVLSGRAHFYEGQPMAAVTFAVRVLAACGIRDLLLTNAAGGINRKFRCTDFMALADHINLMGDNPLRGQPFPKLSRFVDLTSVYDPGLRKLLLQAGCRAHACVHQGVYLAVSGPSYETPAEIRAFGRLGADAVGMSTVPEAIVARQCGLRVAGLSCITNFAAGRAARPLSHAEVLETADRVKILATGLLRHFVYLYDKPR